MSEKDKILVLADVSPSMSMTDGGSRERKTRFDLLKEALSGLPKSVQIVAFSNTASLVGLEGLRIDHNGTTALHLAIELAARSKPVRTIIISDGEPDDERKALSAVEQLTGVVDVVYCGSPNNAQARRFLESLARTGMGGYYETGDKLDVSKQLPAVVAGLLK